MQEKGKNIAHLPSPLAEAVRVRVIGQIETCGGSSVVIVDVGCTVQLGKCVIPQGWIINRLAHLPQKSTRLIMIHHFFSFI